MSSYRVTFVALATFFTIGMTSLASACCNWGYSAPVTYAPAGYGGCGGCGAPTAAAVYAAPVAPAPIYISPVMPTAFGGPCCDRNGCGNCGMSDWSGCGGCGSVGYGGCGSCGVANWGTGCGGCGSGYAAASLYVVNQGPTYTGPGLTVPYATYSPETAYAPAADYPYVPGYGYGQPPYPNYYARPYYRQRYAYHSPAYMHPRYYGPAPRYYRGAPHWRHYP